MAHDLHRPRSRRPRRRTDDSLTRGSIRVDGVERTFAVQPGPQAASPLVLVLHGGGGQGPGTVGLTDLARLGRAAGFATAFPNGLMRGWNDGRGGTRIARRGRADDVAFLLALIDHLAAAGVADASAAFACGISNGAFMSDRLARTAPERVAGIGLVAGTSGVETMAAGHASSRPMPVMMFHGTADPIVPYAGGPVGFDGAGRSPRRPGRGPDQHERGACVGAEALALDWARLAGHDARPSMERLAPTGPGLGVTRLTWQGTGGPPVVLHRIEGGGHTWPGGPQYLPPRLIGPVATGLDASAILLAYFRYVLAHRPT